AAIRRQLDQIGSRDVWIKFTQTMSVTACLIGVTVQSVSRGKNTNDGLVVFDLVAKIYRPLVVPLIECDARTHPPVVFRRQRIEIQCGLEAFHSVIWFSKMG